MRTTYCNQPANETLAYRINYAARVIREGRPTSRYFDGCFEMGDGDDVVKALIKKSEKNSTLKTNLPRYIAQSSIDAFTAPAPFVTTYYHSDTSSGQSLIIDEQTGRTVAVAYDPKDAPLLAAAPALRDALQRLADAAFDMRQSLSDEAMEELRQATNAAYAVLSDAPYTA